MTMADSTFRQQLKTGFIYTAAGKYSGIVISLVVTAILSRLLPPGDFGVIAVAMVFIVFFGIFSDMGLSAAIVQKRNLTDMDIKSLYSYTVLLGLLLGVLFFLCSYLIADIYKDERLIPICQLLSLNVVFATWNIVPNGLLFRDKLFRFIGIRTIAIQSSLAVVSVIAAYAGLGVYALLINPIGGSIMMYCLSYFKYPVGFTFRPRFSSVRKIASYSGYTFGFSLINYFTRNIDKLLIGKVFGMVPLGYYEKSYKLMLLPVQNLTHVITPVLHPILADYQGDPRQQVDKYLKLIKVLALVGFPLTVFLYFTAEPLVILIFGPQWMPSVPVFKILSLSVGLQITGSTIGAFLQATNKTKQLFILGTLNTIFNVSGLVFGTYVIGSVEGVAWMFVTMMYFGLWNMWYIARIVGIRAVEMFKPYAPALFPSLLVTIMLGLIHYSLHLQLFMILVINLAVTLCVVLIFLRRYHIFDFCTYLKNKLKVQ